MHTPVVIRLQAVAGGWRAYVEAEPHFSAIGRTIPTAVLALETTYSDRLQRRFVIDFKGIKQCSSQTNAIQ